MALILQNAHPIFPNEFKKSINMCSTIFLFALRCIVQLCCDMDVMRMEIEISSTAYYFTTIQSTSHSILFVIDGNYIENCSTANLIKFLWAAKNIISFPAAKTILMTEKMRLMRLIYDYERIYKSVKYKNFMFLTIMKSADLIQKNVLISCKL